MNNTIQSNGFFGKLKNTKKRYWVLAILVVLIINGIVTTILEGGGDSRTGTQAASPASDFQVELVRENTGVRIRRYTGSATNVVIPAYIESLPVKVIGREAFLNNTRIANVVIPEGVDSIEGRAFDGASNLRSISIPNSVTFIGQGAFRGTGFTSFTWPAQVTTINQNMFFGARNLRTVTLPSTITRIYTDAFANCTSLTTVNIPDSLTSIDFHPVLSTFSGGVFREGGPNRAFRGSPNLNLATQARLRELGYLGGF